MNRNDRILLDSIIVRHWGTLVMATLLGWEHDVLYSQSNSKSSKAPLEASQQHLRESDTTSKATRVSPCLVPADRRTAAGENIRVHGQEEETNTSSIYHVWILLLTVPRGPWGPWLPASVLLNPLVFPLSSTAASLAWTSCRGRGHLPCWEQIQIYASWQSF